MWILRWVQFFCWLDLFFFGLCVQWVWAACPVIVAVAAWSWDLCNAIYNVFVMFIFWCAAFFISEESAVENCFTHNWPECCDRPFTWSWCTAILFVCVLRHAARLHWHAMCWKATKNGVTINLLRIDGKTASNGMEKDREKDTESERTY